MLSIEKAYEKWGDELVGYATAITGRTDAGDVVADAFADLLRRQDQGHGENRGSWNGVVDPRAYLFRCVLNAAKMRARSAARRRGREQRVSAWGGAPVHVPASLTSDPEVTAAIDRLSPQQRAVVYLTYWDDMTPQRIAETLDLSVGTVKQHLARARAALRKVLT